MTDLVLAVIQMDISDCRPLGRVAPSAYRLRPQMPWRGRVFAKNLYEIFRKHVESGYFLLVDDQVA